MVAGRAYTDSLDAKKGGKASLSSFDMDGEGGCNGKKLDQGDAGEDKDGSAERAAA